MLTRLGKKQQCLWRVHTQILSEMDPREPHASTLMTVSHFLFAYQLTIYSLSRQAQIDLSGWLENENVWGMSLVY